MRKQTVSDLQKRLAHLVNYSSQLIFVGSDALSDQQKYLSDFLAQQSEQTEVSFFTAQKSDTDSDHRRTICRQLANHQVGSFVRPISELLEDLPNIDGTYLVCITQADFISNQLLEELWSWIANIRKKNHTLHLNIVLFGSSQWAEQAQHWLPQNNQENPVLLSSHSVDAVGFDVNALESLMAQKRAFFANKGLFGTPSAKTFVGNTWFIGAVFTVFILVFSTLIAWQYPDEIKHLVEYGELPSHTSVNNVPVPIDLSEREAIINTNDIKDASVTDTLLVSDWQVYVENKQESGGSDELDSMSAIESSANSLGDEKDLTTVLNANTDKQDLKQRSIRELEEPEIQSTASNNRGDFQVPDILSVQELDAKLAQNTQVENEAFSQNANVQENSEAQTSSTSQVEGFTQTNARVEKDINKAYLYDEALLLDLPNELLVLQLSGIQNKAVLDTYISSNNLQEKTWIYQTERYGGPWYVVLYKDTFESIDAALEQVQALPEQLQNTQPFTKSISQIRREISP
ncbi:SPOR domain-containing protein [Agaribacter flavus]|uniref:SPOR domain-containing protein n=1 Tax=Agaribacter flavus TaxID=1902781 RepID=A0ABV7FW76_9ALTE